MTREDCERVCVCVRSQQKPEHPQIEPHGRWPHYMAIKEAWDLWCISVVSQQVAKRGIWWNKKIIQNPSNQTWIHLHQTNTWETKEIHIFLTMERVTGHRNYLSDKNTFPFVFIRLKFHLVLKYSTKLKCDIIKYT